MVQNNKCKDTGIAGSTTVTHKVSWLTDFFNRKKHLLVGIALLQKLKKGFCFNRYLHFQKLRCLVFTFKGNSQISQKK